jgi:hypothetical protein
MATECQKLRSELKSGSLSPRSLSKVNSVRACSLLPCQQWLKCGCCISDLAPHSVGSIFQAAAIHVKPGGKAHVPINFQLILCYSSKRVLYTSFKRAIQQFFKTSRRKRLKAITCTVNFRLLVMDTSMHTQKPCVVEQ